MNARIIHQRSIPLVPKFHFGTHWSPKLSFVRAVRSGAVKQSFGEGRSEVKLRNEGI